MANELIRVPFGADGLPLSITPPVGYSKTSDNPGGFVHNGSEVTLIQTDADETVFGGVNFYGGGEALQELFGTTDGLVVDDKKTLLDDAEVRDANVVQLTSGHISCPGSEISPTSTYEITVDWNAGSSDERSGGSLDADNRMYFRRLTGTQIQAVVGAISDNLTININATGYTTLKLFGNGDVYVDGVSQGNTGGSISLTGGGYFVGGAWSSGSPIQLSTMKVVRAIINGQSYMPFSQGHGTTAYSTDGINALLPQKIFNLNPYPLDDLREVVHPDIYIFDSPWNGFTHWMVYTPYPSSNNDFENPSIEVSNNGIDWEVPAGLTNPLVPQPTGQAFAFNSDPELIYEASTDTLNVIYRRTFETANSQELFLLTSSDGVTWTDKELIVSSVTATDTLTSPTVVFRDNEYFMINKNQTTEKWVFRTADELAGPWSGGIDCTILNAPDIIWHQKMRIVDEKYRMLAQMTGSGGGPLYFLESDDGINWDFDTAEQVTSGGNYRSTFWPVGSASNRSFRMWLGTPTPWQFHYTKWGAYGEFGVITNGSWITDDNALSNNLKDGFLLGGLEVDATGPFMDTGIVDLYEIGSTEKIKIRYKANTDNVSNYVVFARDNTKSFYCNTTAGNVDFWFGNTRLRSPHPEDKDFIAECIYDNGTMSLSIAGGTPVTASTTPITDTQSLIILKASVGNLFKGVFYWLEIEINDVLVSAFYPTANGEITDRVTGVVYPNDGSGSLATELIPALQDGSAAADGNPITNQGGYVHNGSEVSIIQTNSTGAFNGDTIWGDDVGPWVNVSYADLIAEPAGNNNTYVKVVDINGVIHVTEVNQADAAVALTWDNKSYADIQAHPNGGLNLWIKKIGDSVKEAVQYPLTKVFTLAEAEKNLRYFGAGSDPMRDVDGDLILDVNGYIIYTA